MSWKDYRNRIGSRRILLALEGAPDIEAAKTGTGVLLFCPDEVVAVLDSTRAGQTAREAFGVDADIPVLATIDEALGHRPSELVIGVATPGGYLDGKIRRQVLEAIHAGLDIVNGLHALLRDDEELRDRAVARGVRLLDLREPVDRIPLGENRAKNLPVTRVLTVGTDCNVGKMFTSLKLVHELRSRRRNAAFVPPGQTGTMIAGWGVAIDRVISDFISGAAEWLVAQVASAEICVVEGQGAITHPSYSGVSLGLLHGSAPDALILCHRAGRTLHRHTDCRIPSLRWTIDAHERMASAIHTCRVVGIAINSRGLTPEERRRVKDEAASETGLPVLDPGVDPLGPLADAVEAVHRQRRPILEAAAGG